ncbi:hypothetical protein OS493_023427 [Desmophyllum pertusum]|uniref:Uncharacterized protein n=1 Tax=Desmophyllum pertusum TaxID=174260 RepID=A0A9X0D394_9CNID|nr:hypothetical protein OS493_023427 [Desmophyllum pertusum]
MLREHHIRVGLEPILVLTLPLSKSGECGVIYDISEAFPGFCCISARFIWKSILLQGFKEALYQLRVVSVVDIYAGFPLLRRLQNSLRSGSCGWDGFCSASASCEDQSQLVPILGLGNSVRVPSRYSVL